MLELFSDAGLSQWSLTFIIGGFFLALLFWNKKKSIEWFRKEYGIPCPDGAIPLLGHMIPVLRNTMDIQEGEWFDKYGRVVGWFFGERLTISVSDPDVLRQVFVKDFPTFTNRRLLNINQRPIDKGIFFAEGEDWRRIRNILSPTFSANKLKIMNREINRCSEVLARKLEERAKAEGTAIVKNYFGGFTLDVISSTAFGLEVDSLNNPDNPFIKHVQEIFSPPKGIPWKRFTFLAASMFPSLCGIMKYFEINFWPRESIRFFVRECKAMVEDRRKETRSQTDFLQLMINSEAEDTSETQNGLKSQTTTLQKRLTTDEIIGQAFLFFIAGYETTASLLRFTAYELAIHQDVQEKVVKEIDDKLGDEEPNYENINKLQYLEQVLFETLRLFPPLSRLNRAVSEDISIKGMTFPKGSAVFIPVTRIHHDPEFYPNPEEFNPERFEDSKSVQNKFIFMPFGLGPRMCIGMRLALVEAKIALVHVLRRIKFDKSPNTEVPVKLRPTQGLTSPFNPIELKVELRNATA